MLSPNFYAGLELERRAEERTADDWLGNALRDTRTRIVVTRGNAQLVRLDPPAAALLTPDHPLALAAAPERYVLLGWLRDTRYLVLLLDDQADIPLDGAELEHTAFEDLRPLANVLPAEDAQLLAYARALAIWRGNQRFCGRCGAPSLPIKAGHALRCTACGHETFPRIDPAIIVLVTDGERALLGRQPTWPPGRYSTIAGFVEPGESLEDAVTREVHEETAVVVDDVIYHSSQPWPFPSSLMLSFLAHAPPEGGDPVARDGELEDARWFTRAAVERGEILLPPATSISRRLIEHWLAGWPGHAPPRTTG